MNFPFLLNEHGDPRFFFQVFAKNSLMKNIFEDEVEHYFFWKIIWLRRGFKVNDGTVRKSAIFPQPGNQKRLKVAEHSF